MSETFLRRARSFVCPGTSSCFLLVVTLLALVTRLTWNFAIHPPGAFITSDMRSYFMQSNAMLEFPWRKDGSAVFFPYGTAALLTLVRRVFGPDNHSALAVVWAALGTSLVPLVHQLSHRLSGGLLLPRIAALIACFYYPWISYGGYYLSELPFAVCVTSAALFSLRLIDHGRARDAFGFGMVVAIGATFRPQIILVLPVFFASWLVRRRAWRKFRLAHWFRLLVPIALVACFSVARFHHHTGRFGFVSANGPLNYAFGRCHARVIEARTLGYSASFSPPPMGFLEWREDHRPGSFLRLDPALGKKLSVRGTMWMPEPFEELARKCVETTGLARQVKYAFLHLLMLWGFNNAWPDSGSDSYRLVMLTAVSIHNVLILPPFVLIFAASFRCRFARHAVLSAYLSALVIVAVVYFGDIRYRVPYDGLAVVLALDGWRRIYGWAASKAWRGWV